MNAILFQSMPPLSPDEYSALEQSIKAHGIQVPILVDENGIVIDGHHRQKIAQHLGIKCPANVATGKSPAEKRTLSLSLNLDRRHLNREQRRTLVAESIKVDPGLSDRLHAQRAGVSPTTVGTIRGELVASGAVSSLDTRVGADGVQQPAAKPTRERLDHETGELVPETLDEFRGRVLDEAERTGTRVPLTGPGSVATPRTTGLDGKSCPKPVERKQQTRRPITDAFWGALYDLNKKAEALQRLVEDDRFDRNGDALATRNLPQMRQTASTVSAVLAALENHGS